MKIKLLKSKLEDGDYLRFLYTEIVEGGVYVNIDRKSIKQNLKSLEVKSDFEVRNTYINIVHSNVVVTHKSNKKYIQFLINKDSVYHEVYGVFDDLILEAFKWLKLDGIDLLKEL